MNGNQGNQKRHHQHHQNHKAHLAKLAIIYHTPKFVNRFKEVKDMKDMKDTNLEKDHDYAFDAKNDMHSFVDKSSYTNTILDIKKKMEADGTLPIHVSDTSFDEKEKEKEDDDRTNYDFLDEGEEEGKSEKVKEFVLVDSKRSSISTDEGPVFIMEDVSI